MNSKYKTIYLFSFVSLIFLSCTVPKEARLLKKSTRAWRTSAEVLHAWQDSPFGGTFLTLRENSKFEKISSGFGMEWFEAGDWKKNGDTVSLVFVNLQQSPVRTEKFYIHRKTSTLIFSEKDSAVYNRLRVVFEKKEEW